MFRRPAFKRNRLGTETVVKRTQYVHPTSRRGVLARREAVASIPRAPMGFPQTRRVTMRYASWADLTSTSGALTQQVVSCNDIHDPDTTGVGHQPLGYDQWAAFYNHYVVEKAVLTVMLTPDTALTASGMLGIYVSAASPGTGPWTQLVEQGMGTQTMVPMSVAAGTKTIKFKFDAKKYYNIKDLKDNFQRIGGAFGASPNDEAFFVIWAQSTDEATTTTYQISYFVDYTVLVSEPKELTSS